MVRTDLFAVSPVLKSKAGEDIVAQERQYAKHDHCHGQEDDDAALTLGHTQRIQVHFGGVL